MAMQPIYDGPVLIRIDTNQGTGLESLGYSEEGPEVEFDEKRLPVYGDQFGGSSGPPIDIQSLSGIYIVRFTLTKYDTAVLAKIEAMVAGGTAGTANTPGTLLFTESNKIFRLLLSPTSRPMNFLRAVPMPISWNKGVKHSKPSLSFECHQNASSIYYNTTTS